MSETVREMNFLNLFEPVIPTQCLCGQGADRPEVKIKVFRCIKNTLRKVDWLFFKTDTENLRRNFSSGSHFQKISAHGGREGTGGS